MSAETIRPPAVAGMFYPAGAADLRAEVEACLAAARQRATPDAGEAKMLLVPHAGFVYSGAVAAAAYGGLAAQRGRIRRVVLAGPTHRVAIRGLAVPTVDAFQTPLGRVRVDRETIASLAGLPQIVARDDVHAAEHSLEVQLPFLQAVLGDIRIVPLAVGQVPPGQVAEVLDRLWGGDETLIVISSDLSHYLPYNQAKAVDQRTVQSILRLDPALDHGQACGATPLAGALIAARTHGLKARLLDLRSSGDTAGERSRVVGYCAVAFEPTSATRGQDAQANEESDDAGGTSAGGDAQLGAALLARARNAIGSAFGIAALVEPDHAALRSPGASFVTLQQHGQLRGCIGSLEPQRLLEHDVRHNARAAAFQDPRFEPVAANEFATLSIEVSLLGSASPLEVADESGLLQQLRPGVDGLILQWRSHRATFLPQVWEQLPQPASFVAALKRKAGLASSFWAADLRFSRYPVRKFAQTTL